MEVTDYYDIQSLVWLGSYTTIHDYRLGYPSIWVNHTISRQLVDIDYDGEPANEDDFDTGTPYNLWTDPMSQVAIVVVVVVAVGVGVFMYVFRKKTREWALKEIAKFEAEAAAQGEHPEFEDST
jgi:hypothetical protein